MNRVFWLGISLFLSFISAHATESFIVFLVDAKHLDYSSARSFFKTVAKHPSDWSKNGDVGHTWIYLQGEIEGQLMAIEGGHSGEFGRVQPKYFDGVMEAIERGEKNPISYLWTTQKDGVFEYDGGYHRPSCAVKIDLNSAQFEHLYRFMQAYCYQEYAIVGNQCASFVAQMAALIDLDLACEVTMKVERDITIQGERFILWTDPYYASLTFATPDMLEISLKRLIKEGRGQCALKWYYQRRQKPFLWHLTQLYHKIYAFPHRFLYYLFL